MNEQRNVLSYLSLVYYKEPRTLTMWRFWTIEHKVNSDCCEVESGCGVAAARRDRILVHYDLFRVGDIQEMGSLMDDSRYWVTSVYHPPSIRPSFWATLSEPNLETAIESEGEGLLPPLKWKLWVAGTLWYRYCPSKSSQKNVNSMGSLLDCGAASGSFPLAPTLGLYFINMLNRTASSE